VVARHHIESKQYIKQYNKIFTDDKNGIQKLETDNEKANVKTVELQ